MEVFVLASRRIHTAFLLPRHTTQCTRRYFQNRSYRHDSNYNWARKQQGRYQKPGALSESSRQVDDPEKQRIAQLKKEKRYSKSNKPKQLYRAERVLANRSGKTRAECQKLLKKYAVSILEEEKDAVEEEDVDASKLRLVAAKEQIPMNARLFINKKYEVPSQPPLLMVFHKPKWMLSTMKDDSKERQNLQNLKFAWQQHFHPVGRLDYDTSGLLLFSSSGKLTQHLLHPKFEKEKQYAAVVAGTVEEDELRDKLQNGIELADIQSRSKKTTTTARPKETFTTRADLLEVKHWPSEEVAPYLEDIKATLPEEYNVTDLNLRGYMDQLEAEALSEIRLVVSEGKHRMVRRMLASCGHPVVSLKRERMGIIELGDTPEGSFRNITEDEEAWAQSLIKSKS